MPTPAETRTQAWRDPRIPFCRRASCKQPAGHRCINGKTRVPPHLERLADLALLLGAQVDDLQQAVVERDAMNEELQVALRTVTNERDTVKAQNVDLTRRVGEAADDLTGVRQQLIASDKALGEAQKQLKDALARIDDLEHPPVDPEPSRMLVGAGGGNVDRTGQGVDVDRRYYGGSDSDITALVKAAKANHTAGILTWATFKLPVSWASAAAGGADPWFDKLTAACRGLGFEIWIDLHHEPEGDGDGKLWRQFQGHLANRLGDGATGPVKFLLCVTGWNEEYETDPAKMWSTYWPAEAAHAIYAIAYDNPYLRYGLPWQKNPTTGKMEKVPGGVLDTKWTEAKAAWIDKLIARAKTLGVKAAIGECGYSDEAFAKDPAWLDRTFAAARAGGLVAVIYFDSALNSTRSWPLGAAGSAKRTRFEQAALAVR